jgi:hypothetical protein
VGEIVQTGPGQARIKEILIGLLGFRIIDTVSSGGPSTTTDVMRAEGAPSVAMGRTPHQAHDTACRSLR